MNNSRPTNDFMAGSDDCELVAAQWIARRDQGLSPRETAALEAWLAADPRHAEAFSRCEATWQTLPALGQLPAQTLAELMAPRRRPLFRHPVVWASGLAALFALGFFLFVRSPDGFTDSGPPSGPRDYIAQEDAEARFVLPDGSIAELFRGSKIIFDDASAVRRIELLQGEAHFTVAEESARPFIVQVGTVMIRDIGTAFNVKRDDDRVAVLVTKGSVEVSNQDVPDMALLIAGQKAEVSTIVTQPVIAVQEATSDDTERIFAWKGRRLEFLRTSLGEAVSEINRHNQRQLAIADAATAALTVSGSVQADNLDAFVRLLEVGLNVTAEPQGEGQILLRAGP